MKKENVILLTEAFDGGVKTHLKIINENIKEYNLINVVSCRCGAESDVNENFKSIVFFSELSSKNPIKFIKGVNKVRRLIRNKKVKLVHAHSTIAGIVIVLLKYFFFTKNIKFIYTPHAYYSQRPKIKWKKFIKLIEKLICVVPEAVIHVSKEEEKYAVTNFITKKSKSHVIYNGVKRRENVSARFIKDERIVFGNLARLEYQKNPIRFYEIAKTLIQKSTIPLEFIYAGNGEYLQEMRQKAKNDNLQDQIKFIGHIDNIEGFFNSIDCYLSTSYYEGLPYSVVEALSFNKVLFLSNVIGHSELIDGNGILFDLNDGNEEIANRILNVVNDVSLLNEYSRKSGYLFKENFSENKMIEKLTSLYDKVLNSN